MTEAAGYSAGAVDHGRARRVMAPLAAGAGGIGFLTVVHLLDPNVAGNYPTCPWLAITGTYCPGCGSLRAAHALTNGNVGEALARNPFAVVAYLVIVIGWARWSLRMWQGRPRRLLAPAWLLYALAAVIMAFWILRNVPGWTWLSPA